MSVSIIVPVYNSENTLEKCLLSIQKQTYKDIEVVAVDDGSTDSSVEIIKKFMQTDSRFKLIEKENSGVSDTRNIGIKNASGNYLQFVDSDDWIPENATEALVFAAETYSADMVISDFYRVYEHSVVLMGSIPKVEGSMTCSEFATEMMKAPSNFYYGVMWNKLYRRYIVCRENLCCSSELKWCEDFMFNIEYLYYTKRVAVIHTPVYYYVKRPGSLVSTESGLSSAIKIKKFIFSYYKELYDRLELYSDHKLAVKKFYIEFARDKVLSRETENTEKSKSQKKKTGGKKSSSGQKRSVKKREIGKKPVSRKLTLKLPQSPAAKITALKENTPKKIRETLKK